MIDEYVVNHDEYVGVGSGSFGYVGGTVFTDTFAIPEYMARIEEDKLPLKAVRPFSQRDQMRYEFMMKLFGMSLNLAEAEHKFAGRFRREMRKEIDFFRFIGALRQDGENLTLTPRGQYFWVIMMREFFTGVNNFRDACRPLAQMAAWSGRSRPAPSSLRS
jgi:menaquinone C8-methyltransferase